jgi:hypothetical protein
MSECIKLDIDIDRCSGIKTVGNVSLSALLIFSQQMVIILKQ